MTKHSIDIALKISSFFEKCQFSTLRYSANEYVIYKDDFPVICSIAVILLCYFCKVKEKP